MYDIAQGMVGGVKEQCLSERGEGDICILCGNLKMDCIVALTRDTRSIDGIKELKNQGIDEIVYISASAELEADQEG